MSFTGLWLFRWAMRATSRTRTAICARVKPSGNTIRNGFGAIGTTGATVCEWCTCGSATATATTAATSAAAIATSATRRRRRICSDDGPSAVAPRQLRALCHSR